MTIGHTVPAPRVPLSWRAVAFMTVILKAPLKTHGESLQSFAVHLKLGTACKKKIRLKDKTVGGVCMSCGY